MLPLTAVLATNFGWKMVLLVLQPSMFKKWENLGLDLGKMNDAAFYVSMCNGTAVKAKGVIDVTYAKIYVQDDEPAESSSSSSDMASFSSSSDVISSSSSSAKASTSSSKSKTSSRSSKTDALSSAVRQMTVEKRMLYVFDPQGKFLGSLEINNVDSLNEILKVRFHSGVYLVKLGNVVKSVTVK